ncbi:PadR family transcriptional regulator [Williamsia sterculiae]|nr:PadR family transcriptional regulator [Williamsia sterculiae]
MALDHAIMASLAERPGTGYEIGRQFERSIGHFWSATHQQIYRTLKKLHVDGLVEFTSVVQDGRPDKKVYTLSDAGRDSLRRWIAEPTPLAPLRDDISVKIRAAEHGDVPGLLAQLREHRSLHVIRLRTYREFARHDYPDPDALTGRRLHQYLVLRGGIRMEEGLLDWCDEVIEGLQRELSTPPDHPSAPSNDDNTPSPASAGRPTS